MPSRSLDEVAALAGAYLLRNAASGFPDAVHSMTFPGWAGFSVGGSHASEFPRTVLACVLADIADLSDDPHLRAGLMAAARAHSDALLVPGSGDRRDHVSPRGGASERSSRQAVPGGGDSRRRSLRSAATKYFPDLAELPPDVDSLAATARLIGRAAPDDIAVCQAPVRTALRGIRDDGSLSTWIVAAEEDQAASAAMRRGIDSHWGDTTDAEVCAHFMLALTELGGHASEARAIARSVASTQGANGSWRGTWYWGDVYTTCLCVQALVATGTAPEAVERGLQHLCSTQQADGGWGRDRSAPLDTAVATWALARFHRAEAPVRRAVGRLLDDACLEGSWQPSPWIRMEVGRAAGAVVRVATFMSTSLTTAFCLRALLTARRAL